MGAQIQSMTGYAGCSGEAAGVAWDWDIRSVNARGLDIRVRLADGFDAAETPLRAALAANFSRGSIAVSLKLVRRDGAAAFAINTEGLRNALTQVAAVAAQAAAMNVALAVPCATDLLQLRGVVETSGATAIDPAAVAAAVAQLPELMDALVQMRLAEGANLGMVLRAQIAQIGALTEKAAACAALRAQTAADTLRRRVVALLATDVVADSDRLHQELALLAVKTDITEEIDRLRAHVAATLALLAGGGPVGRRLDFLMQEFNREANTLCSKAQLAELTGIGLDLKVVIDQVREQTQNLE